jgi:hypothetical protein
VSGTVVVKTEIKNLDLVSFVSHHMPLPLKRVVHTHAHMRTHICHVATYIHMHLHVCRCRVYMRTLHQRGTRRKWIFFLQVHVCMYQQSNYRNAKFSKN